MTRSPDRDARVPRRRKLLLLAPIGDLAMPFDLVPDFIPVLDQIDDVALGRSAEHWGATPSRPR